MVADNFIVFNKQEMYLLALSSEATFFFHYLGQNKLDADRSIVAIED